jgi:hypothetical protein
VRVYPDSAFTNLLDSVSIDLTQQAQLHRYEGSGRKSLGPLNCSGADPRRLSAQGANLPRMPLATSRHQSRSQPIFSRTEQTLHSSCWPSPPWWC